MRKFLAMIVLMAFSLNAHALSVLLATGGKAHIDVEGRLTGLGHTVTVDYGQYWNSSFDYSGYDVVAFEYGSSNPADIGNLLSAVQNEEVGVVFFRGTDADETAIGLGLIGSDIVGGNPHLHWQYAQNNLDVIRNNHYITQGMNLGLNDLGYTFMSYEAALGANTTVLANGNLGATLIAHNELRVALTPFYGHEDGYGNETALGIQLTENTLQWAAGAGSLTVVPLPAAFWLFGSALAGLGWYRRKHVT